MCAILIFQEPICKSHFIHVVIEIKYPTLKENSGIQSSKIQQPKLNLHKQSSIKRPSRFPHVETTGYLIHSRYPLPRSILSPQTTHFHLPATCPFPSNTREYNLSNTRESKEKSKVKISDPFKREKTEPIQNSKFSMYI